MRCLLLRGNDFCGGPEEMRCHAHPRDQLILSTHNIYILPSERQHDVKYE